ncbi:glycosyltransferase family 2 protein [Leptolinea tardivitalis]|nr:glycosyltransferase family 2 protein [Leptolinea tardivitalis]
MPENTHLPLVTVVTPSFNQAEFLERTIRSVVEQDYPNLEYIIIDGGSTDGSLDIIKKYSTRIKEWVSEPDKGQTDAINKGFARANGQILAWLNSDDTYNPGAVSEAVKFLQDHPDVGLVYSQASYIDAQDRVIGSFPAAQTDRKRMLQGYVHIPQQTTFFRADLWKKIGPLDTSFFFAMDYDLWVRLSSLAPLVYCPQYNWANFRLHQQGKTVAADDRCWPEMLRVHRREGGSWFSIIQMKYYLRRILAPLITRRRTSMFENTTK